MLQLLRARLFSARAGVPLARSFSANSGAPPIGDKSQNAGQTAQKESMQDQVDRLISPETSSGPGKAYENAEYSRIFFQKTTYHPHELDEGLAQKAIDLAADPKNSKDPFVALGLNPLKAYKNPSLLSNFVTDMGKIKPRYKTGLTPKSQRRIAQAIKRARAFGLIPVTSRLTPINNYKNLGRGGR